MYTSIKSKTLGTRKLSFLLAFLLIFSMFTMVACSSKEETVTTQEFELVSCYIEYRNETNWMGGIIDTDEYFHYGYVDENGHPKYYGRFNQGVVTINLPRIAYENKCDKNKFYAELETVAKAEDLLNSQMRSIKNAAFGRFKFNQLINAVKTFFTANLFIEHY